MKTFKLHLIRHGMTAGNLQGLYIGSGTDIPLCDEGRAQLNELKERFEYPQVDTVFSSPLLRAVETANILFPDAKHTFTVHDLREAGFGKFENKPVKELVHDEDFKKWITPGSGYVPEGAEPTDQFHASARCPPAARSSGWQTPAAATRCRPMCSCGCGTVWWKPSTSCPLAMPIPCAVRLRPRRTKPLNKDSVTVSAHPLTEAAQSFIV